MKTDRMKKTGNIENVRREKMCGEERKRRDEKKMEEENKRLGMKAY